MNICKKGLNLICLTVALLITPINVEAEGTIQQMIDNAKPGEKVYIEEGTYDETIKISKPIMLIGKGNVIIKSTSKNSVISIKDTVNVQIENLKLESDGNEDSFGISIKNSKQVTLRNLKIYQFNKGIELNQVIDGSLEKIYIIGNEGHFSTKSNGISLINTTDINITQSKIESVQDGIYVEYDQNSNFENNIISDSRYGVHLMYANGSNISNNHLEQNVTGIMLMASSNILLEKNSIQHQTHYNGYGVLLYDADEIEFKKNELLYNTVGISFQNVRNTTITQNKIASNQTGIHFIKYGESNTFRKNEVFGNILSVATDKNGAIVSKNYWDDYNGFDMNANGYGDTPYQANDSYAKLMIRQKAYQYFFEAPSIVALSKIEKKLSLNEMSGFLDKAPIVQRSKKELEVKFNLLPFLIGSIGVLGGIFLWRKIYM